MRCDQNRRRLAGRPHRGHRRRHHRERVQQRLGRLFDSQSIRTNAAGRLFFGIDGANPFNPAFQAPGTGIDRTPGGASFIGGGVALYRGGKVIGGLGVSGDSSCADHAIAFRMRKLAGYDGIPGGGRYPTLRSEMPETWSPAFAGETISGSHRRESRTDLIQPSEGGVVVSIMRPAMNLRQKHPT